MIKYSTGTLGLRFIFRCTGSVFPKAVVMAVPNAILALLMHAYMRFDGQQWEALNMEGVDVLWTGYTSVLGFLIVFRNNQAYTRFWEGATLIHQVRGEWFNAVSSAFAFCNCATERVEDVKAFQHVLIRLFSMLYCSALQQVCDLTDDCFEIIEIRSMEEESIDFMRNSDDRCEVIMQWIQRHMVRGAETGVLNVPPPLLTRAFQELSGGIVNLNNARKIKEIPFPFPYAQMITSMLMVHWVATSFIASQVITSRATAGVISFFVTFVVWCLVYIAMEIDQPFGDDPNDLPLHDMQRDFNNSLLRLTHPLAQHVPAFSSDGSRPSFSKLVDHSLNRSQSQLPDCEGEDQDAEGPDMILDEFLMPSASLRQTTRPADMRQDNPRKTGWGGFIKNSFNSKTSKTSYRSESSRKSGQPKSASSSTVIRASSRSSGSGDASGTGPRPSRRGSDESRTTTQEASDGPPDLQHEYSERDSTVSQGVGHQGSVVSIMESNVGRRDIRKSRSEKEDEPTITI